MDNNNKGNRVWQVANELFDVGIGFIKAQIIMFLINLAVIMVGLLILGKGWWSLLIALGIALVDILPVVGSGFVFVPWIIYSLYNDNSGFALGLGIIYVIMIALRMIIEPLICGKKIGLSPLVSVAAAIIGIAFFGIPGIIVGPVLAAIGNTVYRILYIKK